MSAAEFVTKQRSIWRASALRLLREKAGIEYTRQVVPGTVDGVRILFPDTKLSVSLRVTVLSRLVAGCQLLPLPQPWLLHTFWACTRD